MIQSLSDRAAYTGARVGLRVGCLAARIFPRPWLYRFSDALARLGFYLFKGFRTRSIKNVGLALGEKLNKSQVEEIARKSLQNFFHDFVEIAIALVIPAEELRSEIPIEGREHLDRALARGKGVIALGGHLGNFFLVGTRLATEGYGAWVLINPPRDSRFARFMDDYRLKVQQKTIHARPRREALRALSQVLRRNDLAVVIADEYRENNGIAVPFFGRTVRARRGPATLALRTGASIVPVYLVHDGGQALKLIIEPELELIRSDKDKTAIRENTLRITQWLERTVRAYPEQWNWMNIHWQEDMDDNLPVAKGERVQGLTSQGKEIQVGKH
jgi:Kdo2-lipid IVA lauroyltransferase/acyltransferase